MALIGCTSIPYTIHHNWKSNQWQEVIDCVNTSDGSDTSCDSCYILKCKEYNIPIDSTILDYY